MPSATIDADAARKPAFILLPTAHLTPGIFFPVAALLENHGYPCVPLSLPSIGASPSHKDNTQDIAAVKECLHDLIEDEGRDVVLVCHGYAATVGGEAVRGWGIETRKQEGKKGDVVRVVYLGAAIGIHKIPGYAQVDEKEGVVTVAPEDAKRVLFNDLDDATATARSKKILPMGIGVLKSVTSYEVWRDVPTTYIYGEKDQTGWEEGRVLQMLAMARKQVPEAFDTVEKCEQGGHCLMVSQPVWLAKVLRRAAGEDVGA